MRVKARRDATDGIEVCRTAAESTGWAAEPIVALSTQGPAVIPLRSTTACPRLAFLVALSASTLCGCLFRPDVAAPRDALEVTPVAADSEMVVVRRDASLDSLSARRRVLLKIAQDCLQGGFQTFAFTAVEEAEPHLPNLPPEAPDKIETIKIFAPPSTVVPDIALGTGVTVKFYKAGDPLGSEAIYAALIVANLWPQPQR